jgi:hypothetical protein
LNATFLIATADLETPFFRRETEALLACETSPAVIFD